MVIGSTHKALFGVSNEFFFSENGINERSTKFPKTTFPNGKCTLHLHVPFYLANWIAFNPIFLEKVMEMDGRVPVKISIWFLNDAPHLLPLSTNRFFRVNGK